MFFVPIDAFSDVKMIFINVKNLQAFLPENEFRQISILDDVHFS